MNAIDSDVAERIFAILVEECGARGDSTGHGLSPFTRYVGKDDTRHEFRFCGDLGFGGKFLNTGFEWRVSCYPEDSTPEIDAKINRANERLAALRNEPSNVPTT